MLTSPTLRDLTLFTELRVSTAVSTLSVEDLPLFSQIRVSQMSCTHAFHCFVQTACPKKFVPAHANSCSSSTLPPRKRDKDPDGFRESKSGAPLENARGKE